MRTFSKHTMNLGYMADIQRTLATVLHFYLLDRVASILHEFNGNETLLGKRSIPAPIPDSTQCFMIHHTIQVS